MKIFNMWTPTEIFLQYLYTIVGSVSLAGYVKYLHGINIWHECVEITIGTFIGLTLYHLTAYFLS